MKILKFIIPVLILSLLLCSCGGASAPVISYEEMTMTLPVGFVKLVDQEYEGMVTFTYGSEDKLITGTREPLEMVLGQYPDMTLHSYAQLIIDSNSLDCQIEEAEGYLTFSFENSDEEQTYRYVAAVYQSGQSFWVIQAGCDAANFEASEQSFRESLASVEMASATD